MRKNGSAINSVLDAGDEDGGRDRVLRTSFWLSSSSGEGCAEPIALDAIRAARAQARTSAG